MTPGCYDRRVGSSNEQIAASKPWLSSERLAAHRDRAVSSVTLGAAAYVWRYEAGANARTEQFYAICLHQRDTNCDAKRETLLRAQGRLMREKVFWALAPVPLGWLIVYGLVWLVRWIRAGFKRE